MYFWIGTATVQYDKAIRYHFVWLLSLFNTALTVFTPTFLTEFINCQLCFLIVVCGNDTIISQVLEMFFFLLWHKCLEPAGVDRKLVVFVVLRGNACACIIYFLCFCFGGMGVVFRSGCPTESRAVSQNRKVDFLFFYLGHPFVRFCAENQKRCFLFWTDFDNHMCEVH